MFKVFTLCIGLAIFSHTVFAGSVQTTSMLTVIFLNCGQGDSIFIQTPRNERILIDTCPDGAITRQELSKHIPFGDTRIDLLILTHGDSDHIGGIEPLLQYFQFRGIMAPEYTFRELSPKIRNLIAFSHISTFFANNTRDIILGDIVIDILYPAQDALLESSSSNNGSLVARLIFGSQSILFTGDAELELEEHLLAMGLHLQSTILKGGHHGSKTSSSDMFIQAVTPNNVIFQNGAGNTFGHPHPDIMKKFEELHIPVYNTSINGEVRLYCTKEQCTISTDVS